MVNRDHMTNAPIRSVAQATMALIDVNQDKPPEHQLLALGAAFLLMTEHLRVAPADVWGFTNNLMNHAEGRRPEFAAVAAYMEGEL